jgi:hypothetical protein
MCCPWRREGLSSRPGFAVAVEREHSRRAERIRGSDHASNVSRILDTAQGHDEAVSAANHLIERRRPPSRQRDDARWRSYGAGRLDDRSGRIVNSRTCGLRAPR